MNPVLRKGLSLAGLLVCILALCKAAPLLVSDPILQIDDFPEYWAATRLNLNGQNPYSPQLMESLQKPLGRKLTVMMWNPPVAMTLTLPFAVLPYPMARLLWLLFQTAIVMLSTKWLWDLYGERRFKLLPWAVSFFFFPTLNALSTGQISPLLLLGIAGFLHYEHAANYGRAGVFAALLALKPHLLYLFWLALLLYSGRTKRWTEFATAGCTLVAATLLTMIFNPDVLGQYIQSMIENGPIWWHTPTLGGALRALFGPQYRLLQFAPMLLGLSWLALHWPRYRENWHWCQRMAPLATVSVTTSAYGWTFDYVVLIAMLLPALSLLTENLRKGTAKVLICLALALNLTSLGLGRMLSHEGAYWWLAPAWLSWYLSLNLVSRSWPREPLASG